jgi:hypothetical protein
MMAIPDADRWCRVYWSDEDTYTELGKRVYGTTDESNSIMHRFRKAFGIPYSIGHNYWWRA